MRPLPQGGKRQQQTNARQRTSTHMKSTDSDGAMHIQKTMECTESLVSSHAHHLVQGMDNLLTLADLV